MTYTLAEKLGMTVARLRREVSASEFSNWIGFYEWRQQERAEADRRAGSGGGPKRGGMGR